MSSIYTRHVLRFRSEMTFSIKALNVAGLFCQPKRHAVTFAKTKRTNCKHSFWSVSIHNTGQIMRTKLHLGFLQSVEEGAHPNGFVV